MFPMFEQSESFTLTSKLFWGYDFIYKFAMYFKWIKIKIVLYFKYLWESLDYSQMSTFGEVEHVFLSDDDYDKLFLWCTWPTKKSLTLFQAGTIVRDSHHPKYPTRHEQDLNLSRTLIEWSCKTVITTTPCRHKIERA